MLRPINPPGADNNIIVDVATTTSNGLMSFSDKLKLDTNILYSDYNIQLNDYPFGGSLGTSLNTVDTTYSILINQTTSGQTLIIPTPSLNNNARYLIITNNGTASFAITSSTISPGNSNLYVWNTSSWKLIATTSSPPTPTFNINAVSNNYTIPDWNSAVIIDTNGFVPVIVLPSTSIANQGQIVVLTRNGSNIGSVTINSNPSNLLNIIPFTTNSITNQLSNLYESIVFISTISGPILMSSNKIDPIFTGATLLTNGTSGWVPAPIAGSQNLFLKGDATWNYPLLEVKNILSNTTTNASPNIEYHIDTTLGPSTINLPLLPETGSIIRLIDSSNTWASNSLTVTPALGSKINGSTNSLILLNTTIVELYFDNSLNNWLISNKGSGLTFRGNWNATTNIPLITSSVGNNGDYYKVSVSGNTNIDGINKWLNDDWIIFNGSNWDKIESPPVKSVNGLTGNVILNSSVIGLGNVNNTSDINKPISTATQDALNAKLDYPIATFENQISTPSNPNAGYTKVYTKTDYKLYKLDNLGNENQIGSLLNYLGFWNANTNNPNITSSVGNTGDYYKVNVSGNTTINGISNWNVNDWIIFNGNNWDKLLSQLTLNDSHIYIGNSSNVPVSVPMTGDVLINNTGVTAIKNSVNLDGVPTLTNTPLYLDNSKKIATTEFVQSSKILNSLIFTNQNISGVLGNVSNINQYDKFIVTQTSNNIIFTLPIPSTNKLIYVENNGSSTFALYKSFIKPNQYVQMYYNGNNWIEVDNTRACLNINSNTTLMNDIDYYVDTTLNSITLTLPATSYNGAKINLLDNRKSWFNNNITLNGLVDNLNQININSGNKITLQYDINSLQWVSNNNSKIIPNMRMNNYSRSGLYNYLLEFINKNKNIDTNLMSYTHGATLTGGYSGGVYSPTQNRIYFVPATQANQTTWHYINCNNGSVVGYTAPPISSGAYNGGVYSPTQNRIYLAPFAQSTSSTWHYIDCNTGSVVPYTGVILGTMAYNGGVYSPIQNRIYFIPFNQSTSTTWHYIDCNTGTVVGYTAPSLIAYAYFGGTYSPTQNRIYLSPYSQANLSTWHYIDCNTGSVVAYTHGITTAVSGAYSKGVYSPINNRIYFVPYGQSNVATWHYINCNTGNIVEYTHGLTLANGAYEGGVYSPINNRIYFAPYIQSSSTTWHYIDCTTESIVGYSAPSVSTYNGGVYSPTQNRIYFVPATQANQTTWHYIDILSSDKVSTSLMAGPMFNKF
jgi:hypothetical protein